MQRLVLTAACASTLACGPLLAQVNSAYSTFGSGCAGTGPGFGDNHVLPAAMTNAYGGSNNIVPFTASPMRYQQVFLGGDLPAAFTAVGLSLRQDERGAGHAIIVDLEIRIGFTTRTPQTLAPTFAANLDSGAPVVVVPRAQITFPDTPVQPTSPADFFLTIPFTNPFAWTPAPGRNLLIDVTIFGNSHGGPWAYSLDATSIDTGRVYGSPATATSGTVQPNYGIVMGLRAATNQAVPLLHTTSTPNINDTFRVRLSHARPSSPAILCFGASRSVWGAGPLPFDLTAFGAPGCNLLTSIDVTLSTTTDATGYGSVVFGIPNDLYLLGLRFHNQFVVLDPPANQLGIALSNAGSGTIGNM